MIINNKNLSLEITANFLLLQAKTVNHFSHSIYIPPDSLPISIVSKTFNKQLSKMGPTKAMPAPWSTYIEIEPNTFYIERFLLNEIFAFHGGCHEYILHFYNGYFYPDEDTYHELDMVKLEFFWDSPIDYANLRTD